MATMANSSEREIGTVRVLWDEFKVNNREIELAVVKGLTGEGFDVEIVPDFRPGGAGRLPMPEGSTVKVYRKVVGNA